MVKRIMSDELRLSKLRCWWCGKKADFHIIDDHRAICSWCHGEHHTSDALDNEEIEWISDLDCEDIKDIRRLNFLWRTHVKKYGVR